MTVGKLSLAKGHDLRYSKVSALVASLTDKGSDRRLYPVEMLLVLLLLWVCNPRGSIYVEVGACLISLGTCTGYL